MSLTVRDQIKLELEDAFATRNGSPDTANVYASAIKYNFMRMAIPDEVAQGSQGVSAPTVGPQTDSTLSFEFPLVGLQTAAGDDTAPTATAWSALFQAAVGTEDLVRGTVITGGTAAVPIVTRYSGGPAAGNVVLFTDANGTLHPRMVMSVADSSGDDALTLDLALPYTPSASQVVYGTACYTWSGNGPTVTLQGEVLTQTTDSDYEFYGAAVNKWGIKQLSAGQKPMGSVDTMVAAYDDDAGTIGAKTPESLAVLKRSTWVDSRVLIWDYSTSGVAYSSAFARCLRSFSAESALNISKAPCPGATTGISGWELGANDVMRTTWTVSRTDDWRDAFLTSLTAGVSHFGQCISFGSLPGRICGVYLPKMTMTKDATNDDDNGQAITTVETGVANNPASGVPQLVYFQG